MEYILLSFWVFLLTVVVIFPVFLLLRFIHLKLTHVVSIKYLLVDSLLLSMYIALLVYIDEHLWWITSRYCECKIDIATYETIRSIFFFCSYFILGLYFLIKRFFLKNNPILVNIYWFIWELLIFTLWAFFSRSLYIILIFFLSWE